MISTGAAYSGHLMSVQVLNGQSVASESRWSNHVRSLGGCTAEYATHLFQRSSNMNDCTAGRSWRGDSLWSFGD